MIETQAQPDVIADRSSERRFQEIKFQIHRELVDEIDLSRINELSQERLKKEIREIAGDLIESRGKLAGEIDKERLVDEVVHEVFGIGPLQIFMDDPEISDILVNGPDEVYIERNGRMEQTPVVFANREHLMQIVQRIAARVGRRADETSPMVDARLPDGSRVNAILPPLALKGPILSIRRFAARLDMEELLRNGTLTEEMRQVLEVAVETRLNVLISGGTGSGKTTLLNCVSRYIPETERLVTIEDTAELNLQRPHVVQLETRNASIEGSGEVHQRDLVRNSLRMRPDRIIIGEVRGAEALDMLQAMNTGHEGSLTTIHANDTRDALNRLEVMVLMAGYEIPVSVIQSYIASAINLLVHVSRLKGGQRRLTRISEIVGVSGGEYEVRDIFGFRQTGLQDGVAVGEFYATGHAPTFLDHAAANGRPLDPSLFQARTIPAGPSRSAKRKPTVGDEGDSQA